VAKRGPKTLEGKLAVRFNASKHGILSPQPLVNAYERAQDWARHREAIIDSLAPRSAIEQLLVERVASCSWRLNRVVLYESERISEAQAGVIESVRQQRKHRLDIERLFAKPGEKVLSEIGILIESHPQNALEDVSMARRFYKTVCKLFDSPPDTPIKAEDAAWVVGMAAEHAVRLAAYQATGEEPEDEEVHSLAESLLDRQPGIPENSYLEEVAVSLGKLLALIKWLAEEARMHPDAQTVDGSVIGPQEALMEKLHTEARYDLTSKEAKAEEVRAQLLAARRDRILPGAEDLQKIARYEAHLSRQMYQALHELKALQRRRSGGSAPLARVDLQGP
jgi:hypothetical protein